MRFLIFVLYLTFFYNNFVLSETKSILKVKNRNNSNNNNNDNSIYIKSDPIIGILEQEVTYYQRRLYRGKKYTSSLAASYVKFVESAGARVIPISIGKDESYYKDILSKVNGVLFPGGAAYFNNTDGYADSGMIIYKLAKKINNDGIYFPLWGTCLGFELLFYLSANRAEYRAHCRSKNQALNLDFKPGFENSRLFGQAPQKVIDILKNEEVTANFHMYCVTEKNLTEIGLDEKWRVLSTNKDWDGFEFISSFEHIKYPFYGVQFHPEKNIYEWVKNKNISHTPNAIMASQYFANFFVNESRKNPHEFKNKTEETESLIYNYSPIYSGIRGSSFQQLYLFPQNNGTDKSSKHNNTDNDYSFVACRVCRVG